MSTHPENPALPQTAPPEQPAPTAYPAPTQQQAPWVQPSPLQGNYSQPSNPAYPAAPYSGQYLPPTRPYNPGPLPYHRLSFADPKNAWWKPLPEGAIGVAFFIVFQLILTVPLLVAMFTNPDFSGIFSGSTSDEMMANFTTAAFENPWIFAYLFGSIAVMFPSLWLARLLIGPKPWGLIHSVAGRLRWGWMLLCTGIAGIIFLGLPFIIGLFESGEPAEPWREPATPLWVFLLLLVTLVPVQCYAEELVFRGYLMQTLGGWLKNPAWAIILPAPLFMLGHGYDLWGQLSVLCMGLTAGFLVWYTGGLEAAIALHIVNNVLSMFSGLMGTADPFANAGSKPLDFVVVLAIELLYASVVVFAARKRKIQRVRPAPGDAEITA